jgi:hypothetical protein
MSRTITAALRERYCKPEWSIFFEVSNGTGARGHRYADAVAMNLFPSRGLEINGFEIKTYRSDWLKELKNPEKAEPVFKYCNRWWIVAEKGLVKPGELPPTWGLIEHAAGKLRQDIAAPALSPVPLDRTFAAALLRRAGEADANTIRAIVNKEVENIRIIERKRADEEVTRRMQKFTDIEKKVAEIKVNTGIDLLSWKAPNEVCAAIKFSLSADLFVSYNSIQNLRNQAELFVKNIDESMAHLKADTSKCSS